MFNLLHAKGVLARTLEDNEAVQTIGHLAPGSTLEVVQASSAGVEERRKNLPPVDSIRNCDEFRALAMEVLGKDERVWHYFSSYANDGHSELISRPSLEL